MSTVTNPFSRVSAQGHLLDRSDSAYGELRRSEDALHHVLELRRRLAHDGYLFLPGYLHRDEVLAARHDILSRLAGMGWTAPGTDPDEAIPAVEPRSGLLAAVAKESTSLMRLLYSGPMIALYEELFGGSVRHFDYTWLRAFAPGLASRPHMDSVFMNRGTLKLLTAWTPLGDIATSLGGLAILEGSHRLEDLKDGYGRRDVDTYCANHPDEAEKATRDGLTVWNGSLADDPVQLREDLGGRWLTTDFQAGDLLTFTIFTVHIGLDNNSDRLRLSSDSRYQPAAEPADPRWVGVDPSAHRARSKRGLIC